MYAINLQGLASNAGICYVLSEEMSLYVVQVVINSQHNACSVRSPTMYEGMNEWINAEVLCYDYGRDSPVEASAMPRLLLLHVHCGHTAVKNKTIIRVPSEIMMGPWCVICYATIFPIFQGFQEYCSHDWVDMLDIICLSIWGAAETRRSVLM